MGGIARCRITVNASGSPMARLSLHVDNLEAPMRWSSNRAFGSIAQSVLFLDVS